MSILDEIKERIAYQLGYWEDEPSAIHMRLSAGIVSGDGKVEERAEVPLITCKDCKHSQKDGTLCNLFASYAPISGGDEYDEVPADVEPDGFCAWAERREA